MNRPGLEIANMRSTANQANLAEDPDSKACMLDLKKVMDWLEHLETPPADEAVN